MTQLTVRHHSVFKRRVPPIPNGLARMTLPDESRVLIERECLDIFSKMTNAGQSLQQTLIAIYLSGMSAAQEAMK